VRLRILLSPAFWFLVALEVYSLSMFTAYYLVGKGPLVIIGSIFIFSSLIYALLAIGLKIGLDKLSLRGVSIPLSILVAAALHSAVLYGFVIRFNEALYTWETLSALLDSSNIYGYLAVQPGDLTSTNAALYSAIDMVSMMGVSLLALDLWRGRAKPQGMHLEYLEALALSVAVGVKPLQYFLLAGWPITVIFSYL
jgi:hypothetical protein